MADNFNITEGVGTAVRAVEKSSKKTQVVTIDVGGAGAESLPSGTLPVSGTVTANLGATDNAVLDSILAKLSSDPATQTTLAAILAKLTADPATQTTLAALLAKFASGTVIGDVNLGATDNAVLDTIDAVLDAINAKLVTGTVIGDVNLGATDNAVLDAAVAVLGATSGAAVITDANGTIQQYLRGLVKLAIDTTPSNVVGPATMVEVTPTISSTAANAAGDFVGTDDDAITLAACGRVNAGTGKITGAVLIDNDLQSIACELWLFDTEPTIAVHSNAAWSIADTESIKCIGVIPFAVYYASALNSVCPVPNLSIPFKCGAGATSLFGALVTRGAPTYSASGLTIRLFIDQD